MDDFGQAFGNNPPVGQGRRLGGGGGGGGVGSGSGSGLVTRLTVARIMRGFMVFMLIMYIFLILREIMTASYPSSSSPREIPLHAAGGAAVSTSTSSSSPSSPPPHPARLAVLERKLDDLLRRVGELQASRMAQSPPGSDVHHPSAATGTHSSGEPVVLRIVVGHHASGEGSHTPASA
jgi:hypothetical protein